LDEPCNQNARWKNCMPSSTRSAIPIRFLSLAGDYGTVQIAAMIF